MIAKNLSKNDKRNALWLGSIVGDAFVLGGHWIYDLDKLQASFPDYSSLKAPLPDSFHKNRKRGDQTHYGDQARHLWQFLSDNSGNYDPDRYRKAWIQFISDYDGYMDRASEESLTALENGQKFGFVSEELGGTARVAAIYHWIENSDQALAAAIDQSRMTHNSQNAAAVTILIAKALAMLLADAGNESPLSVYEVLDEVRIQMLAEGKQDMKLIGESFAAAKDQVDLSAGSIAKTLGQSCYAGHALPVILAVLKQPDDYPAAMKLNVMIGGDSATRAMIIGALLGAKLGTKDIPREWIDVMRD